MTTIGAVQVGSIELWFEDFGGDGEPVLLLAGATLPADNFVPAFTRQLTKQGLRVVRFDQRDTGMSTHTSDADEYSLIDMSDDALHILDSLGVESAHLVTFSLGGAVATIAAVARPERVRSLALIASLSPDMSNGVGPGATDPGYFGGPDDVVDAMVRNLGPHAAADEAWLREEISRWTARAGRWALAPTMKHMGAALRTTPPQRGSLQSLTMPALILQGTLDNEVPVGHAHTLADWLPNATLELIDGLGHIPTEQQWDDIGTRVGTFLAAPERQH